MERSSVVDNDSGGSKVDQIRTSSGMFLEPSQDATVAAIQLRIAELSMLPVENQEAMQVLHYGLAEKYGAPGRAALPSTNAATAREPAALHADEATAAALLRKLAWLRKRTES